jgi:putative ABC transport system ATP-binding protein/lipoprotein-releasing system ATP-binding protein
MTREVLVRCDGAARSYGTGPAATVALQPTTCQVSEGDRIALVGPSGSGKSTLIHLMAGLDDPTLGRVDWPALGDRPALHPGTVAIVFQGPSLLPPLTVEENVALPLVLAGWDDAAAHRDGRKALERLALDDLHDKLPEEISAGQAQRVAIARALAGSARLILADEPTGQLDHENARKVVDVLLEAADHAGAALVVATHDPKVAERFATRWQMHSGRLELIPQEEKSWSH